MISIEIEVLEGIVENYRSKKYDEDIVHIQELGGKIIMNILIQLGLIEISEKLATTLERGLTTDDYKIRDDYFGSNQ